MRREETRSDYGGEESGMPNDVPCGLEKNNYQKPMFLTVWKRTTTKNRCSLRFGKEQLPKTNVPYRLEKNNYQKPMLLAVLKRTTTKNGGIHGEYGSLIDSTHAASTGTGQS